MLFYTLPPPVTLPAAPGVLLLPTREPLLCVGSPVDHAAIVRDCIVRLDEHTAHGTMDHAAPPTHA